MQGKLFFGINEGELFVVWTSYCTIIFFSEYSNRPAVLFVSNKIFFHILIIWKKIDFCFLFRFDILINLERISRVYWVSEINVMFKHIIDILLTYLKIKFEAQIYFLSRHERHSINVFILETWTGQEEWLYWLHFIIRFQYEI